MGSRDAGMFQALEKLRMKVSEAWKKSARIFQALEHRRKTRRRSG
jgi:hypothetical protein